MYSNRPMQGKYVGENMYADGTPMPQMDNRNALSMAQSRGMEYPFVNGGGMASRPYFEEEDTYNKPMRTSRGGGGIY